MATESTVVLLVKEGELGEDLLGELERQGLFVETATPEDFEGAFTVTSPDLVVHYGAEKAASTVQHLAGLGASRRVRLVLVVDRAHLPEMRRLDRSVVISVLSDDMPRKILVERVATLAKKSVEQTQLGLGSSADPEAASGGLPRSPLASFAARPGAAPPRVAAPHPLTPPRAPLPPPPAKPQAPAPPVAPGGAALGIERLVFVDDDVTRAAALAAALRERGYQVLVTPSDPAKTRWAVLRQFAAQVIVTDGGSSLHPAWEALLDADAHLRDVERITAPYKKLFDDATGTIHLESLTARFGSTRAALTPAPAVVASTPGANAPGTNALSAATPPPLTIAPEELDDDDDDRPTLEMEESAPTHPLPAAQPAEPVHVEPSVITDLDDDAPISLEFPGSAEIAPARSALEETPSPGASSATGVTFSSAPEARPRRRLAWALPAAVLTGGIAVGALWLGGSAEDTPVETTGASRASTAEEKQAEPAPEPSANAAQAADAPAPTQAADAPPSSGPDLYRTPEDGTLGDCEALVPSRDELRFGDIAQAGLFWDKARSALVLGDYDAAQAHMCRAAIIHPQTLAVESLAETYLIRRAPTLARKWAQRALENRPGRPKALELLGDAENQLGNVQGSFEHWTQAIGVKESDRKTLEQVAKQHVFEGTSALKSGNLARAEIFFRRGATLNPNNADAALGLSRVFTDRKETERAELWAEEARRRQTPSP